MPRRETFRYSLKAVPLGNVAKPQALTEGVARSRRIGETDYKHKKDGSHTTAVLFNVT